MVGMQLMFSMERNHSTWKLNNNKDINTRDVTRQCIINCQTNALTPECQNLGHKAQREPKEFGFSH
jgi:hypothetical protein